MSAGRRLDRKSMFEAAQWLGDRPQTVLPYHGLVTGRCDAWIAGTLPEPRALLVRTHFVPTEPFGFGRDAEALAQMLLEIDGWTCINVGDALVHTMEPALATHWRRAVKRYGDLYYVLVQTGPIFSDPSVRTLTMKDAHRWEDSPRPVSPDNRDLIPHILSEGLCAAAVIDDRIVSRAFAYATTPKHIDIAAATAEDFRGRGLVTACASMLIERLLALKLTPVWSTGQDNLASQRVAEKLGFVATGARVYLRPE